MSEPPQLALVVGGEVQHLSSVVGEWVGGVMQRKKKTQPKCVRVCIFF
jgi:hypothetical protein